MAIPRLFAPLAVLGLDTKHLPWGKVTTCTTLLLTLLASPAFAQNTDVEQRAAEAYVSCLGIKGDVTMAVPTFGLFGWTVAEETDAGTRFTRPGFEATNSALLSPDGTTCDVATAIGTETALRVLSDPLRFTEFAAFTITTDAEGCTLIQLDATATATLTSGGDPVGCTSPTTSTVRFAFPPKSPVTE